jgi:acetyl/propionyl-CoA carboxylase alpha subunit
MKNTSKIAIMKTDSKIAIFNRGEAALRFIRGVKEFNLRYKHELKTLVILSEDDRASLIERSADDIVRLKKNNVYQVDKELFEIMKKYNCDALWPGWGFASENAELPLQLEKNGMVFIGPGADAIKLLGDKIEAKKAAEKCKIRVIPWEMATGTKEIKKKANKIGYPLILKASDGGGGRGIRIVHSAKQVEEAVAQIGRESGGKIFLEKFMDEVKHIEVQIVSDNYGSVEVYGLRDCSLQRRRQKVIEESPPPFITEKEVEKLGNWSKKLAKSVGYKNAGTVEFLYSAPNDFYFLEMNPRLQVEHGITEETHGIDLVHMQLMAAMGKKLAKSKNSNGKVSIEARIYAEDPSSNFIPAPGKIKRLYFGTGPGIRIDQGVMEGDEISSRFDPMIAKIIASGYSRNEALGRLYRVLDESEILIENGTTNIPFLKFLIKQEEVQKGDYKINDIDNHILKRYLDIPESLVEPSLIAAAILEHRKREAEKVYNFNVRPLLAGSTNKVQPINLTSIKGEASLKVNRINFNNYLIKSSDSGFINVDWICEGINRAKFVFNGHTFKLKFLTRAGEWRIFLDSYSIIYKLKDKGIIKAPSPAIVSFVHVKEDDIVKKGDSIVTLEAMKMEIEIKAKESGIIQRVEVRQGSQVFAGGILARFRSNDEINLKNINILSRKDYPTPSEALDIINSVFTGFEAGENELEMALKSLADFDEEGIDDLLPKVYHLIRQAALIIKLTSPIRKFRVTNHVQKNASGKALLALLIRRPSVIFHNLPENFLKLFQEILLQHGIKKPVPGKELNYSLFLLRRVLNQSRLLHRAITDLLAFLNGIKYRINSSPIQLENDLLQLSDDVTGNYRQTDLAENIRAYLFEKPIVEEYKKNIRNLIKAYLDKNKDRQELKEKIRGADIEELAYLISKQSKPKGQAALLDILSWYFWGEYITSSKQLNIKRKKVIRIKLNYLSRGENKKTGQTRIFTITSSKALAEDLEKIGRDADSNSDALEMIINENWNEKMELRKILSESGVQFKEINFVFIPDNLVKTFRSPIGNAYVETDNLCGLHPASAIRLELWRFSSFKMERVEHRSRLYLFRLQAENKPKDKRLLVMSEVFDPIIEKDEDGMVQMPNVDMAFKNACQMLRKSITFKDERKKYPWNHMILAINPMPSDLKSEDMKRISGSLIPYGARLGIDQVLIYTDIYKKDEKFYLPWHIKIRGKSTEGLFFNQGVRDMDLIRPLDENLEQEIKARRKGVNSPDSILRII